MAAGQSLWTFQIWDDIAPAWRVLRFTSGGTSELVSGQSIAGATSGATALVVAIKTRTGTWAGGDAAGYMIIKPTSGTFQAENLNRATPAVSNIATTGAASLAGAPSIADNIGVGIRSKDFDDTNIEFCVFHALMPRYYDGGGLDLNIQHFSTDTATTTDNVVLDAFLWRSEDGIGTGSSALLAFSAPNSVTAAVADGSFEKDIAQIQFSDGADMESIVAGDEFYFILARDAQHTSDDAAGDLQLVEVELRETP